MVSIWIAPADEKSPSYEGEVGTSADPHRLDQLGNEEADVGVALAVAVGSHVDRHAVDPDGEIGAVVEIEAAQEVLVGFAFA
jgi:hypothetical protein